VWADVICPRPEALRPDASFEDVGWWPTSTWLAAPVVDSEGQMVGVITADDVPEVLMPERCRRRLRPRELPG
jgi:Mg/Co/Ni transporter MgtE